MYSQVLRPAHPHPHPHPERGSGPRGYCLCGTVSVYTGGLEYDPSGGAQTNQDIVALWLIRDFPLVVLSVWFAWFVRRECHGVPWVLTCVAELPAEVPHVPESQLATVPRCRLPRARAWPLFLVLASSPIFNSAVHPFTPAALSPSASPTTTLMHGWPHSLAGLTLF